MNSSTAPGRAGSLRPDELAHAAVMAALCAAIAVTAVALPFAAGLSVLGTVPMALLSYRHRLRVLGAAAVAGAIVAFLGVGLGGPCVVIISAYFGGLVGVLHRRGRGTATALVAAVVASAVFGGFLVAVLAVLPRLRELVLGLISLYANGVGNLVGAAPFAGAVGGGVRAATESLVHHWPPVVVALSTAISTAVAMVGWWALSGVLARLGDVPDVHELDHVLDDGPVEPVPVRFREVRYRYPCAEQDAVGPLELEVAPGEHVAVTGANGSGKTTVALLLSGRRPTSGVLERPGAVGLGRFGGTSIVRQRPESQVLGTRVRDDVVWGLPPGAAVDVDRLLAEVGLAGSGHRDTGGLSGGELQRLALAAALARDPRLLIADEITSMVDQPGRDTLNRMLAGLSRGRGTALVHITHHHEEAATADRVVDLTAAGGTAEVVRTSPVPVASAGPVGAPLLELEGVGHRYDRGTPWEASALHGIDLVVGEGDGVLIHGLNGSGKSTLAWIMSGLVTPTSGRCLLGGRPMSEQVGAVALSFQAARLQLLRGRVDLEIASAAGFDPGDASRVAHALAAVGLGPEFARRGIDRLSGGQLRRVAVAGLLAREPRVLLLDEPLAGLDAASSRGLLELLADLRRDTGLTVIVISHDFTGLDDLCPRALHLSAGGLRPTTTTTGGTP